MTEKIVKGILNGLCQCSLSTEIGLEDTDDPDAIGKDYRTIEYTFAEDLSESALKRMFTKLFHKRVQITLFDDRVCRVKELDGA